MPTLQEALRQGWDDGIKGFFCYTAEIKGTPSLEEAYQIGQYSGQDGQKLSKAEQEAFYNQVLKALATVKNFEPKVKESTPLEEAFSLGWTQSMATDDEVGTLPQSLIGKQEEAVFFESGFKSGLLFQKRGTADE